MHKAKPKVPAGPKAKAKIEKVMSEYKSGTLKSSSGQPVKSRKQAIAISLSEARRAQKKPLREMMRS